MTTCLHFENTHEYPLPESAEGDDVRFAGAMARHFIAHYTDPGEVVFDPFAGFGTTLYAAEALGRAGYGLELEEERVSFIRQNLSHPGRIMHGDARRLAAYDLPPLDFCLTSPPYMTRHHPENPLTAYHTRDGDYDLYLDTLQDIFRQLRYRLKPGGRVIIEAANINDGHEVTTLAWDIARRVAQELAFAGETVLCWDRYGFGYDHSYALLFTHPGP